MEFYEFAERIAYGVKLRLTQEGERVAVDINPVLKNNGVELTALGIHPRDDDGGEFVCPNLYLEKFYRDDMDESELEHVVDEVIKLYRERLKDEYPFVTELLSEDNLKEKLVLRLVSRSRNSKLLENAPYIEFMNLAVMFRRLVVMDDDSVASVLVTNEDMHRWNMDVDELYKVASKNTERIFPRVCQSLLDNISEKYGVSEETCEELRSGASDGRELYILTNKMGLNGATSVLYENALDECAERAGGDIYLLPSSVHEFLFIKAEPGVDEKHLMDMVADTNRTVVAPTDFLSDSAYLYRRDEAALSLVGEAKGA